MKPYRIASPVGIHQEKLGNRPEMKSYIAVFYCVYNRSFKTLLDWLKLHETIQDGLELRRVGLNQLKHGYK